MKSLLLAATALAMLCGPAFAQTSQSNSGSNATVNTASGSQSQSIASPKVNVIGNPIGNGASSSNSGAKATSNTRSASRAGAVGNTTNVTVGYTGYAGVDSSGNSTSTRSGSAGSAGDPSGTGGTTGTGYTGYSGTNYSGSYTVRNTPEVIAPSVVGGNPCAVGASGGLSLPGFGVALGGTWADKACERRQQAALMFNMGETKVAYELMCQDDNVRSAMRVSGKPCAADLAPAPVAQAPVSAAPTSTAAAAPAPVVIAVAQVADASRPEWCSKAAPTTEASKAYVAQVCGR
jgi:hypothetical protein